ncbi:glycoside hydrolase family 18 [Autumnicola musiva]|uniref:mannosyl-glycoprotein endo-beta-N-acetylglucosaminidase n=1 Tax=Autumnicola musiva TaxID=3075589 RepID=A0ABU3D1P1_9FLAO|nr:glycoside hydrolase family 18 [Zunongwangia sp. F117]MDT0675460.1 glycoside hydrolase family 18 [Zunongwangia sp. F117]
MKKRRYYLLAFFISICLSGIFLACDTDPEALNIERPYTYSEEYYESLRAYKESDHQVFYGWYAAPGQLEGVTAGYRQSPSMGEHIAGVPDSLDFLSLWFGIPSLREDDSLSSYNPIAYEEMRFAQEVKGTKMLVVEITRMEGYSWLELSEEGIRDYGDYLMGMVFDNDLDGLDLDYEPEGDWIAGENFATLVEYIGNRLGPMSENPDKYLIIDYYNQTPPPSVEPYINYLVNQAYTQGRTSTSAQYLQSRYNQVSDWLPTEKFIVTENLGEWYETGGAPFTEADGNTMNEDGEQIYSLEGMARWNPRQGEKGGFGGFYFGRDYINYPPYQNVRQSIQAANPAVR